MSIVLRILLIVCSILVFLMVIKKIKQSKLKIEKSLTWMIGSILLVLMSIFSNFIAWISGNLGFISPSNFVFVVIILFLLIQVFFDSIHISELNEKIKDLDHYMAIKEYEEKKRDKE